MFDDGLFVLLKPGVGNVGRGIYISDRRYGNTSIIEPSRNPGNYSHDVCPIFTWWTDRNQNLTNMDAFDHSGFTMQRRRFAWDVWVDVPEYCINTYYRLDDLLLFKYNVSNRLSATLQCQRKI